MSAQAAVQFGQVLYTSLIQTGVIGPALPAIISPISVWFAMVLLLNGAGIPSTTYTELFRALSGSPPASSSGNSTSALSMLNSRAANLQAVLADQSSDSNKLIIANALWTKGITVNPAYATQMKTIFGAEAASVKDVTPINAWAAKATNYLIPEVLPPGFEFNMALTNAVYFKGMWEYAFDKSKTQLKQFKALGKDGSNKMVSVQMMSRVFDPAALKAGQVAYREAAGQYKAIRLPYQGQRSAAVFVLPDEGAYKNIFDAAVAIGAVSIMDSGRWSRLPDTLALSVPRFKVSVTQLRLKKALQALGIKAAFDQAAADFSRASSSPLFTSDVLQSAVVQMDESGTEAAAVTAATMVLKSAAMPREQPTLVFDRPFLFFLVDASTQTMLFQGVVTDPSST